MQESVPLHMWVDTVLSQMLLGGEGGLGPGPEYGERYHNCHNQECQTRHEAAIPAVEHEGVQGVALKHDAQVCTAWLWLDHMHHC